MTTKRTDDSVALALGELRRLEADRIAEEEASSRRAEAAERARLERLDRQAREQREHAKRLAEAEASQRVEEEMRTRDAEAARRVSALRAELEAVHADRERIAATVARLAHEPRLRAGTQGAAGWRWACGAATLVAAGLAALLVLRPPVSPEPIAQVPLAPVSELAPSAAADVPEPSEDAPAQEQPSGAETETEPAQTDVRARTGARRGGGGRDRGVSTARTGGRGDPGTGAGAGASMDRALDFEHCGDDPTCGADID